jgi:hypothetical protein
MSKSHLIVPKGILQIVLLTAGSALCLAPPLAAQNVTGQGTSGKIAKFTGASTIGNSVITESSTRIGIGTNTPASKLTVIANNGTNATILGRNTGSGPGVNGTSTNGSPGVSGTATHGTGIIGNGILGVYGQGNSGGSGVYGNSSAGVGVYGNSVNNDAVYGSSTNGIGVHGVGSQAGVHGEGNGYGVLAQGGSYGVAAYGSVGIYAAPTSGNTVAGLFGGNVQINGNLTKSSGSFKIDHPLDPANKYLLHSFVESPDMKNIYDGTITLDERGEAVVPMPDYFSALNQDFRYQLTAIGAPAPGLYVAQKMADNHFKIAGGKPGMEVSWQVTGIRHDAYAKDHRIAVEEDKGKERGYYLYPAGFSEPREKSVESFALREQSNSDIRTVSSR